MDKDARLTRNRSMENLKEKSAKMEMELNKLAEEMREAAKKYDDNSKRMEDRMAALISNQQKAATRAVDDRMNKLEKLMEQTMSIVASKFNTIETGDTSGTVSAQVHTTSIPAITQSGEREEEKGKQKGIENVLHDELEGHYFVGEFVYEVESEDLRRGEEMVRQHARRNARREHGNHGERVILPKHFSQRPYPS